MPDDKTVTLSVRLPQTLRARLRIAAIRRGMPVQDVVCELIKANLKEASRG